MNRVLFVIACVLACSAAQADEVDGIWKTQPDNGAFATVQMAPCGAKICGTMVQAYDLQGKPIPSDNQGAKIVWDMEPLGGGKYANGKILQPSTGRTYKSKMQLDGRSLRVSGCVLGICRAQTWSR